MNDQKEVLNAILRKDFRSFSRQAFATVSPGDNYLHNWHIDAITHCLAQVAKGEITRLVITMPPRHLKSTITSVAFPAWVLGGNPTKRIICASYSQHLATALSEQTRKVMESDWYKDCFPATVLSPTNNTKNVFDTTQQGARLSTSVEGSLTGFGADILIIDDPHKAGEANSPEKLDAVYEWFTNSAATRLNNPKTGCIIVVQQRLKEQDLAGRLLETGSWTHLNLPAIAEAVEEIATGPNSFHKRAMGEALHPERMSLPDLAHMKVAMGTFAFSAQYQQRPCAAGSGIINPAWFGRYKCPLVMALDGHILQSWDIACTMEEWSDYSVCTTYLYQNYRLYLINVYRVKLEFPTLLRLIPAHAKKWEATSIIIEAIGSGRGLYSQLVAEQHVSRDFSYKYWANTVSQGKTTRLIAGSMLVESGRVFLPEQDEPWLQPFLQELESFPNGKYDDQVDSFSQALKYVLIKMPAPPPGMFKGYQEAS